MDLRFAKCAWFALFENGIIEFVENPFQEEEHNARRRLSNGWQAWCNKS
jgi:hypothetical protein